MIADRAKVQAALTAFETSFEATLSADQLAKFQALVQGAGPDQATDALPGCPPASSSSGS